MVRVMMNVYVFYLVVEVDHVILDRDVALHVLHNTDHDNMMIRWYMT